MSCKVFIFGSCVSRDIFNFDTHGYFKIVDYFARHSMGSLASKPFRPEYDLSTISSDFRRRMVLRDFDKSILQAESALVSADIILLDLIDERFDLIKLPSGEILTSSAELAESKLLLNRLVNGYKLLKTGSEERRRVWMDGATKLFTWLSGTGNLKKVMINEVYWSSRFASDNDIAFPVPQQIVMKANSELSWMYSQLLQWLTPSQFMRFPSSLFVADANHRWGASPFHYIPAYYESALEQLKEVHRTPQLRNITQALSTCCVANSKLTYRDISRWKGRTEQFSSVEEYLASDNIHDGLNEIQLLGGLVLDVLHHNFDKLKNGVSNKVLVCLSGAVSNRSEKKAPFFSGLGVAESLDVPLISFSDPVLALDDELSLAWYAGNESSVDLPFRLAQLLDNFAKRHHVDFVIIGGSGGGFAALQLGTLLQSNAETVVWNPQTSIADYNPDFVSHYLKCGFSQFDNNVQDIDLRQQLSNFKVRHDLKAYSINANIKVLYLQNQSDWHTEKHAGPYFKDASYFALGQRVFQDILGQIYIAVGGWGQGHIAPSKELLVDILSGLFRGRSLANVALELEQFTDFACSSSGITWFKTLPTVNLLIQVEQNGQNVHIRAILEAEDKQAFLGVKYAFYLMVNGVRHSMRWYEDSPEADFDVSSLEGKIEIISFAKDAFGDKVITKTSLS